MLIFFLVQKKHNLVLVSYADFTSVELTQRNCSNRRENVVVIVAVVVIIAECLLNNTYSVHSRGENQKKVG